VFSPDDFIKAAGWQVAASVPEWPHEYSLPGKKTAGVPAPPDEVRDEFIAFIGEQGEPGEFLGHAFTYWTHPDDGYIYWASPGLYVEGVIVNRRKQDAPHPKPRRERGS